MSLGETDPLGFALVEAEIATRPCAPLVVGRKAHAGLSKDARDAILVDVVVLEWVRSRDVGLGGHIPLASGLVRTDRDIAHSQVVADPFLKRLDLHHACAPAHL